MQIYPITNTCSYCTRQKNYHSKTFFCSNPNIFVKPIQKVAKHIDKTKLLDVLNGDSKKLTKEFFENLSPESYQFCLDWAKSDEQLFSRSGFFQYSSKSVLTEDVQELVKYADFYYSGLQAIAKRANTQMKQVLLVGIGQSPVAIVKTLELIGVNTAYCPISGLASFNEPIEKYVTKENVEKYFSYWKNFGFNIDDLFGDKLVIFTDYQETGNTLHQFKQIIKKIIKIKRAEMRKQGKQPANIKFLSLKEIFMRSPKDKHEEIWGDDFENAVFHSSYLKTLYSPLFKLPLEQIKRIKHLHQQSINSDRKIRFNRFSVLLYDALYYPQKETPQKYYWQLANERNFRLSFYTPGKPQN